MRAEPMWFKKQLCRILIKSRGEKNMKLGAYFWDGWYAKIPHWTDRLMRDFTCREPVWGWQGSTVENMELQINYAADAGLSFFAFDWYYPQNGKVSEMNNAVDRFLASSNHNRMKFCLLVANHEGGYIFRDKWEDACRRFMPYLTNDDVKNEGYIIYAPHHSFAPSHLNFATFKWNGKYILEYAKSHPEFKFVFKPHPQLKTRMIKRHIMSEKEVDNYFEVRNGLTTGDNNVFLRLWHEISLDNFQIFSGFLKSIFYV